MKIIINGESGCDMPTYTIDLYNCVTVDSIRDAIYQALLLEGYGNNQVDDIMNITKDADIETKIPYSEQTVIFSEKKEPLPIIYDFFPPEKDGVKSDKSEREKIKELYFGFYDQMDEPERSEAKENWNYGDLDCDSIAEALYGGFSWNGTPQGHNYWIGIKDKYVNK